jgi:hypothetical protein
MINTKLLIAICSHRGSTLRELCSAGWIKRWGSHPDISWFFYTGNDYISSQTVPGATSLDCYDDYDRLPGKTKAMCNYALSNYNFEWLFKCDDDTWVNPERLLKSINPEYDYMGDDHGYRCNLYYKNNMHPYGHGGSGYVLSRRAARIVGSTLNREQRGCEDLIVGLILTQNGIALLDEPRLQHYFKPQLAPSPANEMISIHGVDKLEKLATIESKWQ